MALRTYNPMRAMDDAARDAQALVASMARRYLTVGYDVWEHEITAALRAAEARTWRAAAAVAREFAHSANTGATADRAAGETLDLWGIAKTEALGIARVLDAEAGRREGT